MHGNVREYCQDDWHDNYKNAPDDGTAWIGESSKNSCVVVRGGSCLSIPRYCRSASRYSSYPRYVSRIIGFLVVCG